MEINTNDFGALCVCAVRYCIGRRTYMPGLIQDIVREHFEDIPTNDLQVILKERDVPVRIDPCDQAGWLKFWEDVETEIRSRK